MATESKHLLHRLLKPTMTLLGGAIGAIFGAVVGARTSEEIGRDLLPMGPATEPMTETIKEPSLQARPFRPELRFPSRPGPDWSDSKPSKLPKPTYAPVSVAFGLMLGAAGVVTSFWVSVAGLIVFVLGLANWIGGLVHEH
jgi:hypothetical protein